MSWRTSVLGGRYRLVRPLEKGGMGSVYEAVHVGVDRAVAVKYLHDDFAGDPEARKRFELEAKAAGRIGHDNICEALDFGVDESGKQYFVMPLLRGEDLSEAIYEGAPFPIERASDVACQTLSALSAAHKAGIIHRDLKPENIFLTTVGDREDFVKVLDFGISKMVETMTVGGKLKKITRDGTILGTPYYMSPEQARGAKSLDGRVDVYSLGVILYEMLTGELPFDGESPNEILWQIWNAPVVPPSRHRPSLHPALEGAVLQAIARDLDDRFASAEEMRAALVEATNEALAAAPSLSSQRLPADAHIEDATERELSRSQLHRLLLQGAAEALEADDEDPTPQELGPVEPHAPKGDDGGAAIPELYADSGESPSLETTPTGATNAAAAAPTAKGQSDDEDPTHPAAQNGITVAAVRESMRLESSSTEGSPLDDGNEPGGEDAPTSPSLLAQITTGPGVEEEEALPEPIVSHRPRDDEPTDPSLGAELDAPTTLSRPRADGEGAAPTARDDEPTSPGSHDGPELEADDDPPSLYPTGPDPEASAEVLIPTAPKDLHGQDTDPKLDLEPTNPRSFLVSDGPKTEETTVFGLPRAKPWLLVLGLSAGVIMGFAIAILLVPTPERSAPGEAGAPPPEGAVTGPAEAAAVVTITFSGLPDGATVTVDGTPAASAELELERSREAVEVFVTAPGFRPWRRRVSTSRSRTVTVDMARDLE